MKLEKCALSKLALAAENKFLRNWANRRWDSLMEARAEIKRLRAKLRQRQGKVLWRGFSCLTTGGKLRILGYACDCDKTTRETHHCRRVEVREVGGRK